MAVQSQPPSILHRVFRGSGPQAFASGGEFSAASLSAINTVHTTGNLPNPTFDRTAYGLRPSATTLCRSRSPISHKEAVMP